MVQEETGLPRRFAPRNDGAGFGEKCRALAGSLHDDGRGVIASGSVAIELVIQEEAGLPRRFAPRNDGAGFGEKWLALAGSLRVRSR